MIPKPTPVPESIPVQTVQPTEELCSSSNEAPVSVNSDTADSFNSDSTAQMVDSKVDQQPAPESAPSESADKPCDETEETKGVEEEDETNSVASSASFEIISE